MTQQRKSDWLAPVVVAVLLILTAWGNAVAMFIASLLGLLATFVVARRELARGGFLAAAVGCVVALVVAVVMWIH
jgi:hypothetical protein